MIQDIQSNEVEDYKEEIKEGSVLVYAFTDGCIGCKRLNPVIEEVSDILKDIKFYKFDRTIKPDIYTSLKTIGVPTLVLYRNGVELDRHLGYAHKEDLMDWIDSTLKK